MNRLEELKPTSGFPVSIATGLALETLFTPIIPVADESRVVENLPDLSVYTLYAFNVTTVLRNLLNGYKYADIAGVRNTHIYEVFEQELQFLVEFFRDNNVPIQLYLNTYRYFKDAYKDKLRTASTDKQHRIEDIIEYCVDRARQLPEVKTTHKDLTFGKNQSVLAFTHIPADLLSYGNFATLDLLESHTGAIKSRKNWNTKYYPLPDKDMSFLPFMEYLLVTFGDHVMFKPSPLKERLGLYETLKKKGVNPLTSELSLSFILR